MRSSLTSMLAITLAVAASAAAPAAAGTYVAYSCHTPTGEWASTEGWRTAGNDPEATLRDDCEVAGANNRDGTLLVEHNAYQAANHRQHAAWVFRSPSGTTITAFRAGMCAYTYGSGAVFIGPAQDPYAPGTYWHGPPPWSRDGYLGCRAGAPYWNQTETGVGNNYFERSGLSTPELWFSAWCGGEPSCAAGSTWAYVHLASIRFSLRDDHPPVVSRVAGPLAGSGGSATGALSASFEVRDVGAGAYRSFVEARVNQSGEWRTLNTEFVDRDGGRCAPARVSDSPYEFLYAQPCRAHVADARATLHAGVLTAGDHLVRVQVEDASGNRADVVPPRIVHVETPERGRTQSGGGTGSGGGGSRELVADNGRGASTRAIVRLRRSGRTVRYRAQVDVAGRLVDEHDRPIVAAKLQVDWRRLIPRRGLRGAPWRALGTVTTRRDGRFVARVPADLSRALRFAYRASAQQPGFTSAAQFSLRVRAHVALRAVRKQVRNGTAATFTGRVAAPVPRGGVPVTLQAWVAGRGWTPARTERPDPRTDARGRFRVSYRFARTYRRARYIFRVVVGEDSAFPFVRSSSRRVRVIVVP